MRRGPRWCWAPSARSSPSARRPRAAAQSAPPSRVGGSGSRRPCHPYAFARALRAGGPGQPASPPVAAVKASAARQISRRTPGSARCPAAYGRLVGRQVRAARELTIERLELRRGVQEQRGCIVSVAADHGEMSPQERGLRALEPIERIGLRRHQQAFDVVERPGQEARLRRGQRALGAPRRVLRQLDRSAQEGCGGGDSAPRLRPSRRSLELERRRPRPDRRQPSRGATPADQGRGSASVTSASAAWTSRRSPPPASR